MRTCLIRAVWTLAACLLLAGSALWGFQASEGPPYPVGNGVSAPVPIFTPKPGYPEDMDGPVEGEVYLQVVIDEKGIPENVKVVKELYPKLDAQAVKVVKTWRFRPGMKDGEPVPVIATVAVAFKLR